MPTLEDKPERMVDAVRGREAKDGSMHVEMEENRLQEGGGGDWVFPIQCTYRICYYSTEQNEHTSLHFIIMMDHL